MLEGMKFIIPLQIEMSRVSLLKDTDVKKLYYKLDENIFSLFIKSSQAENCSRIITMIFSMFKILQKFHYSEESFNFKEFSG